MAWRAEQPDVKERNGNQSAQKAEELFLRPHLYLIKTFSPETRQPTAEDFDNGDGTLPSSWARRLGPLGLFSLTKAFFHCMGVRSRLRGNRPLLWRRLGPFLTALAWEEALQPVPHSPDPAGRMTIAIGLTARLAHPFCNLIHRELL
jgi:hypothetical protein